MAGTKGTAKKRAAKKPAKRAKAARGPKCAPADLETRLVDTAIELAEEVGWDALRLRLVADRLGIPLASVLEHTRDLDGVADAWFRRAWAAMLAPAPKGFAARPACERLHLVLMRWFDALADHRDVTGQMLRAKLYPSHPHHWAPMIFSLSRCIHWLREAALLDATGRRRQMEEIGLSALFLATLMVWLNDETPGQERTRAVLRRRLAESDRIMARVWGAARPPGAVDVARPLSRRAGSSRRSYKPAIRRSRGPARRRRS